MKWRIWEWEGNEKYPFPQFGNGKGMKKKTFPNSENRKGMKKKTFSKLGNGNQRLSFSGMDGKGNSCLPLSTLMLILTLFAGLSSNK